MTINSSYIWLLLLLVLLKHGILETEASHSRNLEALQPAAASPSQIYRTSYHFQPPKNWMNDPNGPMVYKGLYHLFYQYNPLGADWGNIVWAHSTSTDLINWNPHKPAIFPSQEGDINGCWSGSTTIFPGGKPAILYTGINPSNQQVQNLAVPKNLSDPYLIEWDKSPYNPLMTPTPENKINSSSFRDPTTAWLGPDGRWRVIIGNKLNRRGKALLYRSKDFVRWTKAKHPLHSVKGTGMWECPDFYPVTSNPIGLDTSTVGALGIKHVLKVSLDDTKHDQYAIGTYDHVKDVFDPDAVAAEKFSGLRYDYGKFYASKTFYDSLKKRRILWGWINESLSREDYIAQGWSGVQGIPRLLWLDKSGKQLMQWPIKEIETLRENKVGYPPRPLKGGSILEVQGVKAAQADVDVSFELSELKRADAFDPSWTDPQLLCSQKGASIKGGIGPFGLKLLASKDMQEYTAVFFRIFKGQYKYVVLMCSDQSRSSLNVKPDKTTYGVFLDVDPLHEQLSLRSLIDHSIVESFGAKGKACITSRVYPTKALDNEAHLYVFNNGLANVTISNLSAWSMKKAHID
ncbi:hypothetical protein ACH5RR_024389 [Cinchona calisaya]|uniref:Beta-fructofuranosidase n=1 Tax=Cinchona calisaya TaxID=153742 RepID=A0ABD2YZP7_9GENT